METIDNTGMPSAAFEYSYDNVGNKLAQINEDNKITQYEYYYTYQLTSVTYPDTENDTRPLKVNYAYDPAGNRLSKTEDSQTVSYEYNQANQMLSAGGTTFQYDANGNRILKSDNTGTFVYEYNFENLLAKAITPDNTTTYDYDGLNRRILKSNDKDTTRYLYHGLNVLQELSGRHNQKVVAYYRANNMLVISQGYNISQGTKALSYQTRPEESRNYYAHDGLGSVAALSNHQGKSTERYKYDAFGELRQGDLTYNPYGFTGKRYDTESGLYQFHFRKYDPATGVWTTPDPIDIVGGLNLYGYVMNNPVNLVDPLGLDRRGFDHSHSDTQRYVEGRKVDAATNLDTGHITYYPSYNEHPKVIQQSIDSHELTHKYNPDLSEEEVYQKEIDNLDNIVTERAKGDFGGWWEVQNYQNYELEARKRQASAIENKIMNTTDDKEINDCN